jgi:hypothetical protein
MKDAGEFLGYLLSLFPVNTSRKKIVTYGTNNMTLGVSQANLVETSVTNDTQASVIQFVDQSTLLKHSGIPVPISTFLIQIQDNYPDPFDEPFKPNGPDGPSYIRRISVETLEQGDCVIFSLRRLGEGESFIATEVIPEEEISVGDQTFHLTSIVLYTNMHYVCTIECNGNWYLYDDMRDDQQLSVIGSYGEMLQIDPRPTVSGTLYFYTT